MQELSYVFTTIMADKTYDHEKRRIQEERAMHLAARPDLDSPIEASYSLTITESTWVKQVTISTPAAYMFGRGTGLEDFKLREASKFHFILELRNDGTLTIQDVGSSNGTSVDGMGLKRFKAYSLPESVIIAAGLAVIKIVRQ